MIEAVVLAVSDRLKHSSLGVNARLPAVPTRTTVPPAVAIRDAMTDGAVARNELDRSDLLNGPQLLVSPSAEQQLATSMLEADNRDTVSVVIRYAMLGTDTAKAAVQAFQTLRAVRACIVSWFDPEIDGNIELVADQLTLGRPTGRILPPGTTDGDQYVILQLVFTFAVLDTWALASTTL